MVVHLLFFIHVLIFLLTLVKASVGSKFAVNFTTVPRDTEYLVGSEAILQWKYSSRFPNAVRKIKFGIVALPEDSASASEDVAIFVKNTLRKEVQRNTRHRTDVIASLKGRTRVVESETASFKIESLTLNDTGKYFCRLEDDSGLNEKTHYVRLKVVDLMIDHKNSTLVIDSWKGHKVTLKCAMKKAFHDSTVRFFWTQQGQSVLGKQVDWKTLSQMTMVTATDDEFGPVTCVAKTDATTQQLEIKIKRLYPPSEPVNVTLQEIHSNDSDCKMYNKLTWSPPLDTGETEIIGYLVEYKHPAIKKIINRTITHHTEHLMCKMQISGHPRKLNFDVRGINIAGRGFRSDVVKVPFFWTPSAPLNLTSSLMRKEQLPFDAWLSWNRPYDNGGMPVLQYLLEYKVPSLPWESAEFVETNHTYMLFIKYDDSYVYQVRVTARNHFGFGAASKVITVYFAEKPDPPQNLIRGEIFYGRHKTLNLKVTWERPKYDGGASISHYIVEHKTEKKEWSAANNTSVNVTEFAFEVQKSQIYTVRVRAVNRLETGEPSTVLTIKLTAEDMKNIARSSKSSTVAECGIIEPLLLLLAVFHTLA